MDAGQQTEGLAELLATSGRLRYPDGREHLDAAVAAAWNRRPTWSAPSTPCIPSWRR